MTELKSWVKENQTLVLFLFGQAIAIAVAGASVIAYYVKMETRVSIMETRGAAYTAERLGKIDERLTVLEQMSQKNAASIERIVDRLTK